VSTKELSGRTLDIAVAERVMKWPRRDRDDDQDYAETYFSAYNDGGQIVVYWEGSQRKAERWSPAQNIEAAMQVEDRILELGLSRKYAFILAQSCVGWRAALSPEIMSALYWELAHASAEQRCRAALAAIGSKE
jgi:Phage ABA sandwich domain